MATTTDLLQDVYANFLSAYKQGSGSRFANVIAFEAIGLSPGLSTGSPNSESLAVESVSREADALPDISTGTYTPTMRTVSVSYGSMLNVSTPASEQGAETFNSLKASAREALQNSTLGSQLGPDTFYPAFATPANWYDETQLSNWTSYSYQATPPATTSPTPTVPVVYHPPIQVLQRIPPWQLRSNLAPAAAAHEVATPALVAQFHPQVATATTFRQFQPATSVEQRAILGASPVIAPHPVPPPIPTPVATPAAQPTLQPAFNMSFEYCIVQLYRPWLSGDFLATAGWYVPGAKGGDYSSGPITPPPVPGVIPAPTTVQPNTGVDAGAQTGPFAYIPVAFIAVKSLVLNSAAIDGGNSAEPPTAFGPFSLSNATGNSNALSRPGIQIIAWICNAQPMLPPATDPALIPPSTADQVVTDVGTAVDILGGLFGGKL